jgi:hypothetical protein
MPTTDGFVSLEEDLDNVRAALEWSFSERGRRVADDP